VARLWFKVTGDSYITHAMPVGGAGGMATYLSKYMMKTFGQDRTGMSRRWSTSWNWPGNGRVRLRETVRKNWAVVKYMPGHKASDLKEEGPKALLQRTGPAWAVKYMRISTERASRLEVERMLYGNAFKSPAIF